jgi:glycosyltransferase involved in cell wall biosynthesis
MDLEPLRAEIAQAGVDDHFEFDLRYLPEADLTAWLDAADLAVFPYHDVDGSGALVVAANAGLPIVASAVGGFAEAPVRDHVSLVPPADPTLLAAELDRLLSDPDQLEALRLRATSLVQDLTSWSEFAKGCLELYAILGAPTAHA